MIFTIVINGAPYSGANSTSFQALNFTRALLAAGHTIGRLFFYGDGVYNLNAQAITPQGEFDLPAAWADLINEHKLDSVVCIAAAARRGILDTSEAKRHQKPAPNLMAGSELSGLGQLIEATTTSDRVITFN